MVPKLRKQVIQKEAEEKMREIEEKNSKILRAQIMNGVMDENKKGNRACVSDLAIAYDFNGRIMKIKRPELRGAESFPV